MRLYRSVIDGKNKLKLTILLLAVFLISVTGISQAAVPDLVVSQTVDEVIRILSDESLKGESKKAERRSLIRGAISKGFNFEAMAKRSMGKYWKERSPEEREEFTGLFRSLIEISYISKIEGFTNEKILYEKARTKKNISVVKTKIVLNKGTEIPINYRLMKRADRWYIYDVVIEGVSLVRNYRTQFSSVLRKKSYPKLVEQLKAKIEKNQ